MQIALAKAEKVLEDNNSSQDTIDNVVKNQFESVGELRVIDGAVTVNTEAYNRVGKNVATKVVLVDKAGNVLNEKAVNGAKEVSLDASSLEAGTYGVHVSFEDDELSGILINLVSIK